MSLPPVAPMAPRPAAALPVGPDWLYEVKWDGYRVFAYKEGHTARLRSRNDKDLTRTFPQIASAVRSLDATTALLDGEIVALDVGGRPSFQLLQSRADASAIVLYAFDLLHLNGRDLTGRPLIERKRALARVLRGSAVRLSDSFTGDPAPLVDQVRMLRLEGVIAKRASSRYRAGDATWLKLKLSPEQEFVIGGFERGRPLESVLVGYYDNGTLLYAGNVRQGLNPRNRRALHAARAPLASAACPFANLPNARVGHWGKGFTAAAMRRVQWVRPSIVAQIAFTEWTRAGNLRHPAFRGLRPDKDAADVTREGEDAR